MLPATPEIENGKRDGWEDMVKWHKGKAMVNITILVSCSAQADQLTLKGHRLLKGKFIL